VRSLESERARKRRELFEAQDRIEAERDLLIGQIEKQLAPRETTERVFLVRWSLV
jgi:adenine-specific DNA-methyltransferase